MRGAVASGHPLTSTAAARVLGQGGNAFDACVAAALTASVAEPCLTSLGGGGFMLACPAGGQPVLYDFFVDSPGKGAVSSGAEPHFVGVPVHFTSTVQVFHTGMGSVAVPGMLPGLLRVFADLCTMDMPDLAAPALRCLTDGVVVGELQGYLLRILRPILTAEEYGREIYATPETGDTLHNPLFREFLALADPHEWLSAYARAAAELEPRMAASGCLLTARDMREYGVVTRAPLGFEYRGAEVLTNGPPSFGGGLLERAMVYMATQRFHGPGPHVEALVAAMEVMYGHRSGAGGTTHISVLDSEGNAASMTSSNGSNSGCFLGSTGIMLNNMMGEDDLHPGGFHLMEPGVRVGSMMSPSVVRRGGRIEAVLGSGGSKRIRTAMLQVLHNLMDRGMDAGAAVEEPRVHLDDEGVLQAEPGFEPGVLHALAGCYPLNHWACKDLYFGGVHTVVRTQDGSLRGHGDSRRGGSFLTAP
jgi:gamma-glutamyltranspeptidase/glutathione hydrolase